MSGGVRTMVLVVAVTTVSVTVGIAQTDKELDLARAAARGDLATVQNLITKGADVNAKHAKGPNALMLACINAHPEVVQFLLAKGADVNAKVEGGEALILGVTPLMFASMGGNAEIAKALVAKGAEVNAKVESGQTALLFALGTDHPDVARVLLSAHADAKALNENGTTALMFASALGYRDIVEELLVTEVTLEVVKVDGGRPEVALQRWEIRVARHASDQGEAPRHRKLAQTDAVQRLFKQGTPVGVVIEESGVCARNGGTTLRPD